MHRIAALTTLLTLSAVLNAGCERGPDPAEIAAKQAGCNRQVADWQRRQETVGAAYEAKAHFDAGSGRCLAHVVGGETAANRFESVVDVGNDVVIAGCSAVREAMGDTPCQVNGEPASGPAGRMTIKRLTGQ